MNTRFVAPAKRVRGELAIPGDKSISHRAAIFGLLAEGETRVRHFLQAADCLNTLQACEQLGAGVCWEGETLVITGRGLDGLQPPSRVIDCGNSGTGVRLLSGVLAGQPFTSTITGDEQVQRRPMNRVIRPLEQMGARIESREGGLCPLVIHGRRPLQAIDYVSPVASAQVKSCVLLAGLFAVGETWVSEPSLSRDHTERMLAGFGASVLQRRVPRFPDVDGAVVFGEHIGLAGGSRLQARDLAVPGDISSAAFFLVAATLLPGSELHLPGVGINRTRTGILSMLRLMGARVTLDHRREQAGEPVADITVAGVGALQPAWVDRPDLVPTLIDEIPVLAVAATAVRDRVEIRHAKELRVKETDRIQVLAGELRKLGIRIDELEDGMVIHGGRIRGGEADAHGDHRLAMSLAVAGLVSEEGVTIHGPDCVQTSFPGFWELLDAAVER